MAENKLLLKGFAWLVCCAISCSAWAGRPVRVYEVDLKGGQSPASLQDAMREALVRTTGRRESATDPALANLISEAQNYVKSYSPATRGQSPLSVRSSQRVEVSGTATVPLPWWSYTRPLHALRKMPRGSKWSRPRLSADSP
jgi:hypothetical protein